jgi:osmoprotectant transport system ATP-binding protein
MIRLSNISKSFNHITALSDITMELSAAQTSVLIGPSGCGKSTLIKIIVGLIKPNQGKIYVDKTEVTTQNIQELRRKIGYVIQEGGLFPHLTAKENVILLASYCKWKEQKMEQRVEELADLTKISFKLLSNYPAQLSGGQRQRISLMRALMLDPDLLLLDEPLGALDPMIRYNLQTDLQGIFKKLNKTVLMVTHDLVEAKYFGNHIILMNKGKIIQQGKFENFLLNPAEEFVRKFIQAQRGFST